MASLYRRVLGEKFDELHPLLRRFHSSPRATEAAGTFRVRRSSGRLTNLLADLLGLPPAGKSVRVLLKVVPHGTAERWVRCFGDRRFVTVQSARRGHLVESAGPACFELEVQVDKAAMTFRTRRVWLLGFPLPPAASPVVSADVVTSADGWLVGVRIRFPLLGTVLSYEGKVVPLWTPP